MTSTVGSWLQNATSNLNSAGITTARLDCLVLLEDATNQDRSWLLAHADASLTPRQLDALASQLKQRAQHVPLAYIRQKTEFYGREFYIDHRVLEPRPESETIIDLLKSAAPEVSTIVDVGTGSGALAITAKLELPQATVIGIDIDAGCLAVAASNGHALQASVEWRQGDLLEPFLTEAGLDKTILLCNLPYVPDDFHINQAAAHEPELAIFGGPDGLELYRRLFEQINSQTSRPKLILTESLPPQHADLKAIAAAVGYQQVVEADFIQQFKPV